MLTNVTDTQQVLCKHLLLLKHSPTQDFPGGPVDLGIPCFHCRGAWFNPQVRILNATLAWPKKNKTKPKHNSTVLLRRVTDQFLLSRSTTRGWGLCVLYIALSWGQQGSAYAGEVRDHHSFLHFR